jgi:hypothetical protein
LPGRKVEVSIRNITIRQYRELFDPQAKPERDDEIIAGLLGMAVEDVTDLSVWDYKAILGELYLQYRTPLQNPT